jgi:SAM-dependent MidA family methyltransferase
VGRPPPAAERSAQLTQLLRREISGSPISFARFMELTLYHPSLGYYGCSENPIGRAGDFITSVSVGRVFGALLACHFQDWHEQHPHPAWQIVEGGAHDGQLAVDILTWLRTHAPDSYARLAYWLLEPSSRRQTWQASRLAGHRDRVRWARSWDELPAGDLCGAIFANELLDAMPAHRLAWDAKQRCWCEWGVAVHGDAFVWERMPLSASLRERTDLLPAVPEGLAEVMPDGFTTELSPLATEWWGRAANALQSGQLMTLDYGYTAEEELAPWRPNGTLRSYRAQVSDDRVLEAPGTRDLTAHVNFGRLLAIGERAGLRTELVTTQGRFLGGLLQRLSGAGDTCADWSPAERRQLQTLTHPSQFGQAFRVLIQARDASPE